MKIEKHRLFWSFLKKWGWDNTLNPIRSFCYEMLLFPGFVIIWLTAKITAYAEAVNDNGGYAELASFKVIRELTTSRLMASLISTLIYIIVISIISPESNELFTLLLPVSIFIFHWCEYGANAFSRDANDENPDKEEAS